MINRKRWLLLLVAASLAQAGTVLVYGGSPGGVAAAVHAARMGETVRLVEPSPYLGGVVAGGLTRTDIGKRETVGGFPVEFFNRALGYYTETYGADSQQVADSKGGLYMEPHIAARMFAEMLAEAKVTVQLGWHVVAVECGGTYEAPTLVAATFADDAEQQTQRYEANGFIDASYEGDLMALAHVPYVVGRESRGAYDEPNAGIRFGPPEIVGKGDHCTQAYNYRLCLTDREDIRVYPPEPANYDPSRYDILLQFIEATKPDTIQHTILNIETVANGKYDANNCGYSWQSTDWVGHNYTYPESNWADRQKIAEAHLEYVQGLFYFLQNDPRIPEALRQDARQWGLASDEFTDHGNWPTALYVRECRRLLGAYVFTENDARFNRHKPDGIGLGSYTLDSHGCRVMRSQSRPWSLEGGLGVHVRPYEIPYGVLCPPQLTNLLVPVCCSATHVGYSTLRMEPVYMILGQAAGVAMSLALDNQVGVRQIDVDRLRELLREQGALLDAPFEPRIEIQCSATEVKVGEPVTFELVEKDVRSPLTGIWWELDGDGKPDSTERSVSWTYDREQTVTAWLVAQDEKGQWTPYATATVKVGEGGPTELVLDEANRADCSWWGRWDLSTVAHGYLNEGYRHDANDNKGERAFRFRPDVKVPGKYLVSFGVVPHENRATNLPLIVYAADGEHPLKLDERTSAGPFPWVPLGIYEFKTGTGGSVLVRNNDTDGFVVVDSLRMVYQGP